MPAGFLTFLLVFLVLLAVLSLLGLVLMVQTARRVAQEVAALGAKIEKLEARVTAQQREVAALKRALAETPDTWVEVSRGLGDWRRRGLWGTVFAVGSRLLGSYLKARRAQALPGASTSKMERRD